MPILGDAGVYRLVLTKRPCGSIQEEKRVKLCKPLAAYSYHRSQRSLLGDFRRRPAVPIYILSVLFFSSLTSRLQLLRAVRKRLQV